MRMPRMRSRWQGYGVTKQGKREGEREREERGSEHGWEGEEGEKKREASEMEWIKASTRGGNKERTKKVEEVGDGGGYRGPL